MKKKLIEIAVPLEAINVESGREKSIRHGHPSTLHLWWSRKPLATCRAVLFASLVDDPSSWPEKFPTEAEQKKERQRLFDILGKITVETDKKGKTKQVVRGLVSWQDVNNTNSEVLENAQKEIARSIAWNRNEEPPTNINEVREYIAKYAPPVYDPFCGGGSIPLEAQRLGLQAIGSDLNPVAVLITKALIEIPPKFKDKAPVNPDSRQLIENWQNARGLAEDVRYYGKWMREEAFKRIRHLYPQIELPAEFGGDKATVIAWLWARTVKCPNPGCGCQMPLVNSFQLSTKKGKEAYVKPIIDKESGETVVNFHVVNGKNNGKDGTVNRKGATCIACDTPVGFDYIRSEGKAGRLNAKLMAIVAQGNKRRIYLSPNKKDEKIANSAKPEWKPEADLPNNPRNFNTPIYGIDSFDKLFTNRQLVALTTFSNLISKAREKIKEDALNLGVSDDGLPLNEGGKSATAYADAVATYLALAVDKLSDRNSAICSWDTGYVKVRNTFARQAIPMVWGFAEANPLSDSTGNFLGAIDWIVKVINNCPTYSLQGLVNFENKNNLEKSDCETGISTDWIADAINKSSGNLQGIVNKKNATTLEKSDYVTVISTDPPYYDNIGYADLADFFYVWLRPSLNTIYPDLFDTLLTPKKEELVANSYRFGGDKKKAKVFFEEGLKKVFTRMHEVARQDYPLSIYYAFKQSEVEKTNKNGDAAVASTGWETMLEGLINSGFQIGGTWPMRTELSNRSVASGTNALASSIVLVCRSRPENAPKTTRKKFVNELKRQLPKALKTLQQGNIAPVDFAQASIGPGMAVFSKYAKVLESDGKTMGVRSALQLINQILDEYLSEQEGEFDSDTRWALTWYEQYQFNQSLYGEAETLSKAKNTSVQTLVEGGILEAKEGKVRLLDRAAIAPDWNIAKDTEASIWKITQYLIRELEQQGETGAAKMLASLGDKGELARDLAYRLYNLCDRKKWTTEALAYNSLVISWPEISRLALKQTSNTDIQTSLDI